MITVVNKYKHISCADDRYIGRPTPLGNPFSWLPKTPDAFKVKNREEAIQKYEIYIKEAIINDSKIKYAIDVLTEHARNHSINLVCYCSPLACHGDILKKLIEDRLSRE